MDRFKGIGDYLSNVNRSVLLAIGLVVVAGLIAATFIYGESNNGDIATNGEAVNETMSTDSDNDEEATNAENGEVATGDENGEEAADNGEGESLPSELADTGAALPAAGMVLLGASGYLYKRSQKQLTQAKREE